MEVQITYVLTKATKPANSVSKICSHGNTTVFLKDGVYNENI